ncbi:50S ribosomal protein L32 [Blattabacterium cuenoti]|uniref:50S ribosomal protein L32 n=1 Tax=Blattabacterium cuenoti TaxID=1653831 RepID=UPI00163D2D0F|nr:50S ribosomal protein L32 [Blattabacterium cuenoti]
MAHPKRRQSKSRKNKRRTHLKIKEPLLIKCSLTKEKHLYHHAYWNNDDELCYRGKILFKKK